MLEKFFAVTITSLYEVITGVADCKPYIRKIGICGESKVPLGGIISGDLLAVCKWLQFFIPEGSGLLAPTSTLVRRIEKVSMQYWQGSTNLIVALFLSEEAAQECFSANNLRPCDPRWLKNTREVIAAIGSNHPTVTICHYDDLALLNA